MDGAKGQSGAGGAEGKGAAGGAAGQGRAGEAAANARSGADRRRHVTGLPMCPHRRQRHHPAPLG